MVYYVTLLEFLEITNDGNHNTCPYILQHDV